MRHLLLCALLFVGALSLKMAGDEADPFFDGPEAQKAKAAEAPKAAAPASQEVRNVAPITPQLNVELSHKEEPYAPHPLERSMYADETKAAWSYDENSETGPENWSTLDSSFKTCSENSQAQAPLDLFTFRIASPMSPLLTPQYKAGNILVRNTGNYVRLVPHRGSMLYWGDKIFELVYAQVHTPSEHHMAGETFPVEIQFIHKAQEDDQLAVLALLYKQGLENPFIERILEAAPEESGKEDFLGGAINLGDAIPKDITQYKSGTRVSYPHYTYDGSLTTPPCRENVRWFVWSKPDHISKEQITRLTRLVSKSSARPIQAQNTRVVEYKTLF
jgi:carbonic anhydrase